MIILARLQHLQPWRQPFWSLIRLHVYATCFISMLLVILAFFLFFLPHFFCEGSWVTTSFLLKTRTLNTRRSEVRAGTKQSDRNWTSTRGTSKARAASFACVGFEPLASSISPRQSISRTLGERETNGNRKSDTGMDWSWTASLSMQQLRRSRREGSKRMGRSGTAGINRELRKIDFFSRYS